MIVWDSIALGIPIVVIAVIILFEVAERIKSTKREGD
jgi:hypothetical protein